jgi:hypothetical protein
MPRILHLFRGPDATLAVPVIETQRREPDTTVTVVLLPGATPPPLPAGITVRRLDEDCSYSELLDLVFESSHVLAW